MSGPTKEQIEDIIIQYLFPKTTSDIALNFAVQIGNVDAPVSGTELQNLAIRDAVPADLFSQVKIIAKKVIEDTVKALRTEGQKYINVYSKSNIESVGKFSDDALNSLPIIQQLILGVSFGKTSATQADNSVILLHSALQYGVTTAATNFINQAQLILNTQTAEAEYKLKELQDKISAAAYGSLIPVLPIMYQKIVAASGNTQALTIFGDQAFTALTGPASGAVVNDISSSAIDTTVQEAFTSSYASNAENVSVRGAQAIFHAAEILGPKQAGARAFNASWWNLFVKAAEQAAEDIGNFSQSLPHNQNASLADNDKVQSSALAAGITSGAYVAQALCITTLEFVKSHPEQSDARILGFWDTLKSAASTIGQVVKVVCPVAAKVIPILLA